MKFYMYISTALLFFSLFFVASSQTDKGRIEGKVLDAKTGEGLIGANVVVKGTYYGGTSDIDGNVKIERVNPGVYTVDVSLLGYKVVEFTGFKVEAGKTATLTAKMEETVLSIGQDIVVVGQKPLFDIEETASRRNMTGPAKAYPSRREPCR